MERSPSPSRRNGTFDSTLVARPPLFTAPEDRAQGHRLRRAAFAPELQRKTQAERGPADGPRAAVYTALDAASDHKESSAIVQTQMHTHHASAVFLATLAAACAPAPDTGLPTPALHGIPFGPADSLTTALTPVDFDGDGTLDLGVGTGKHEPAPNMLYTSSEGGLLDLEEQLGEELDSTFGLAFGDLDRDGRMDFVAANDVSYHNRICLQQIDGGFDCRAWWRGWQSRDIDLVDLNGDGLLELIFTNKYQLDQIFFGGNLDWEPPIYVGQEPDGDSPMQAFGHRQRGSVAAAIGDVDLDGSPDVVIATRETQPSALHYGTPDGLGETRYLKLGSTRAVLLVDVDDDGALDLLAGNLMQPNLLLRNRGDGTLGPPEPVGPQAHNTWALGALDLDGDGLLDLIEGNAREPDRVHMGLPGGRFDEPFELDAVDSDTRAIAVGDFDDDGDQDFVVGRYGQQDLLFLVE